MTNSRYKILTPSGWSPFDGIKVQKNQEFIKIEAKNGTFLKCTSDHLVKDENGIFIKARDSLNKKLQLKENISEIVNIIDIGQEDAYDVLQVEKGNQYLTNDFISHNCEFLGSSGTLIAGWKLKELVPAIAVSSREGSVQYVEPKADRIYCTIADVSHGKGLDYSAFHIIDISEMPYRQVFTFRDNSIPPFEYAETINRISRIYNYASVLVESNDIGGQVVDALFNDLEYENIIYTVHSGRAGKVISNSMIGGTGERGIRTTKTVKSVGCSLLKLLIEQNQLIINDKNTIEEIKTFSKKANSYEAEKGKHDDLVMPLVLFAWMSDQNYFKELTDINTLSKLREKSADDVLDGLLPFGFINSYFNEILEDTFELGSPVDEDLLWLLG